MVCRSIVIAPGFMAIACGSRIKRARCSVAGCLNQHTRLCDHPLIGATCDAKICGTHATRMGVDLDACPAHAPSTANSGALPADSTRDDPAP